MFNMTIRCLSISIILIIPLFAQTSPLFDIHSLMKDYSIEVNPWLKDIVSNIKPLPQTLVKGRVAQYPNCEQELSGGEGHAMLLRGGDVLLGYTTINEKGYFSFENIPPGTYMLIYKWSIHNTQCEISGNDTFYFEGEYQTLTYCESIICYD